MKKNEKMQSNKKMSSKNNKTVTDNCNKTTNSNNKSVGFVTDSDSFELDHNDDHSFELRDCK